MTSCSLNLSSISSSHPASTPTSMCLLNASKDMEARSHPLTPDRNKRGSDPGEIGRREAPSRPIGKMLQRRRAGC